MKRAAFYFALFTVAFLGMLAWRLAPELTRPTHLDPAFQIPSPFELASLQIATVGTANGQYFSHLHFEMREFVTPFIGPGYREKTDGWLNPSDFIAKHRGAPEEDVGRTGQMPAPQSSP